MSRNWIMALAMCGALLSALSGCGPGPDLVSGPGRLAPDQLPLEAYPRIVPLGDVESKIVIRSTPATTRDPEIGRLTVVVPLRSIVARKIVLRYRFTFFDEDGTEVERNSWNSITVAGQAAFQIRGRSLRPEAVEWRLDLEREF